MIRWTPSWRELASDLVTTPVGRPALLSRFSAPARGLGFWVALWSLVAAAEFAALLPVLFPSGPVVASDVVSRLLGGSFAACGLIAWRHRPDSRSGPLMIATGAGFFIYPLLSQIDVPVVQTIAFLGTDLWVLALKIELAAYFVASEALANVAKYAQATQASVRVVQAGGVAIVEVADDGVGGADEAAGSGLRGLADRVETLGGRLHVTSPPGEGTVVIAELPVALRAAPQ